MNTRIKELRNYLNLSQKDFGNNIGLQHSSLSDIERGKAPVTERTIIAICSKFNVNEEWLKTGKGEMFNIEDEKFDQFFNIYNNLSDPLQEFLLNQAKELLKLQNKL